VALTDLLASAIIFFSHGAIEKEVMSNICILCAVLHHLFLGSFVLEYQCGISFDNFLLLSLFYSPLHIRNFYFKCYHKVIHTLPLASLDPLL